MYDHGLLALSEKDVPLVGVNIDPRPFWFFRCATQSMCCPTIMGCS